MRKRSFEFKRRVFQRSPHSFFLELSEIPTVSRTAFVRTLSRQQVGFLIMVRTTTESYSIRIKAKNSIISSFMGTFSRISFPLNEALSWEGVSLKRFSSDTVSLRVSSVRSSSMRYFLLSKGSILLSSSRRRSLEKESSVSEQGGTGSMFQKLHDTSGVVGIYNPQEHIRVSPLKRY